MVNRSLKPNASLFNRFLTIWMTWKTLTLSCVAWRSKTWRWSSCSLYRLTCYRNTQHLWSVCSIQVYSKRLETAVNCWWIRHHPFHFQTYHSSVEESGSRDWRTDPTAANSDEPDDLLPFPTLEKLLKTLDINVGLNVEIKYPQFIDVMNWKSRLVVDELLVQQIMNSIFLFFMLQHGENGLEHELLHFFDRNDYLDTILEVTKGILS